MWKPLKRHNIKFSFCSLLHLVLCCYSVAGQVRDHAPADWKLESQRKEIAPVGFIDSAVTYEGHPTLVLAGGGKEYSNGYWYSIIHTEPGEYFQFQANFMATNIEESNRSVLARIIWLDNNGKKIGSPEYPGNVIGITTGAWSQIKQLYKVPKDAMKAKIELVYRWDANGMVRFAGISFQKATAPKPRIVKVASIHHRPRNSTTQQNLLQFSKLISRAASQKPDIICLPEGITLVGTDNDYVSASETVPGPTTEFLGEIARKHNLYIVAGILERNGEIVYNTAVLIDRDGNLAGKYRKVSLPQEEIDGGITPGNSFPVFETDFGKIGLMICWDVTFPEPARALAQKGAEIIFLPIWGGDVTLTKARAIENQVYIVSSTYDMITAVFDREGKVIKEAKEKNPVVMVEVDLNKQTLWPWLGDLKSRISREMPPQKAMR